MKVALLLPALAATLTMAGCAAAAQDEGPEPGAIIDAEAGCADVVADEYEQQQRPPELDVRSIGRDGRDVVIAGLSRGNTTSPAAYEFKCRHSDGATVLEAFDRAEHEETPAVATSQADELAFDEVAGSLTDEQFDEVMSSMASHIASMNCQSAAGFDYVPEDEKPYRSDMQEPIPYLGGHLVTGKIMGANGMVANVRCHVDANGKAKVDEFDVVS